MDHLKKWMISRLIERTKCYLRTSKNKCVLLKMYGVGKTYLFLLMVPTFSKDRGGTTLLVFPDHLEKIE